MTIWRKTGHWTYEYFDRNTPADTFPGFEDFVRHWTVKRGSKQLPAWSDYDVDEMQHWWGSLIVADFTYNPFDLRYRLFGTKVVERFGFDATNKWMSALLSPDYDTPEELRFYEMIASNMLIARTSGQLAWLGREFLNATFVELPLSDTGDRATHTIALMQ